jgi:cobalt-zinc-cadmium efflux system outer membrane protein
MVFPPLALRRLAWLGAGAAFVAFATGCAAPYDLTYPEPRPLGPVLPPPASAPVEGIESERDAPGRVALAEPLTLDEAVALALVHNPDLRAAAFEVRAREGEAYQAARAPNPELEIDVEEFGGSGDRAGTAAAEIGAGVSQTLELGGDRRARAAVAARGAELGAWEFEAARLDLVARVHEAFAAVLAAETRLALAEEQRDIARRFADAVDRRAEAGAISPLEARRSAVAAATAEAALGRARRALDAARARLAPLLGLPSGDLEVAGDLDRLTDVPPYEGLLPFLALNPDVARYRTALAQAEAQVALERARRIPDPTFRAGGTYFNEVNEGAVTAGISIPIPFFDTNRGAIQAARARVSGTAAEAEAALLRVERELAEAYGTYAAAAEAARILRDDALPNARAAFEGIETGYREGEYDLLAVLDAQRALVETQNALADALADVAQARAAVERLVATPLDAAASGVLPNPDNE